MDAGIYAIYNTVNDKLYIGSAVWVQRRFNTHRSLLQRGIHHSPRLQSAWNKHGRDAFEFSCLEVVSDTCALVEREQAWIDALRTTHRAKGYNISPTAGSALGVKHTEVTRAKISAWQSGRKHTAEHVEKQRLAHIGMKRSAETIEKIRLASGSRKHSAEAKEKNRLASTGKKKTAETIEKMRIAITKCWAMKRAHTEDQ